MKQKSVLDGSECETVAVQLPANVLCRLLREKSLVAEEFKCLDEKSSCVCRKLVISSLKSR